MYNVCVNAPMSIIKNDTVLETALISVSFWIIILIVFLTPLCYLFRVIMVFAGHESPLWKKVIVIKKKYVHSVQEMKALERKGYTLWAMAYFVDGDGSALYIMAK